MPQALTGTRKSMPKVVRVNASDDLACLYKNLGNGRRIPFIWGTTVTLASGTTTSGLSEVVVASGVQFNEFKVCNGVIQFSPVFTITSGITYYGSVTASQVYIEKDTTNNVVKLKSDANVERDCDWDITVFLGDATTFTSSNTTQIFWKPQSILTS